MARSGAPPPSEPLPIPTSARAPADAETIRGEMQPVAPCLTLLIREGDHEGRLANLAARLRGQGWRSQGWLLTGLMEPTGDALNSERLELRGEYVDVAPADATIPAGCEAYPLFLAGHVRNVS